MFTLRLTTAALLARVIFSTDRARVTNPHSREERRGRADRTAAAN